MAENFSKPEELTPEKRAELYSSLAAHFGIGLEYYGRMQLRITFVGDRNHDYWYGEGKAAPDINPGHDDSDMLLVEPDDPSAQIAQILTFLHPKVKAVFGSSALYYMLSVSATAFGRNGKNLKDKINGMSFTEAASAWVISKRIFASRHTSDMLKMHDSLNDPELMDKGSPIQFEKFTDEDRQAVLEYCELTLSEMKRIKTSETTSELPRVDALDQVGYLAPLSSVPNGEPLEWLYRVVSSGTQIKRSNGNRHESILGERSGDTLRFTRTNKQKGTTLIVEIAQADKYLSKTSKTFKKLLLFSLQKMAAQHEPLEVGFALQELVDLGMYATTSNATRGIKEFFSQQKQTTLSGTLKKGRNTIREEGGILFYHYRIENGYVKLSVNENFNLDFITSYYTVFPRFAYALSNNAFTLVRYIFYIARQNTNSIKNEGTFKISLDTIRENLGLPDPEDVKNRKYKQYIVTPIEEAIEEIGLALQTVPEAKEYSFTITPVVSDSGNIRQWLEGYLEISLKGNFAETFVKLATNAEAQREKLEKAKTAELAKLAAKKELENRDSMR